MLFNVPPLCLISSYLASLSGVGDLALMGATETSCADLTAAAISFPVPEIDRKPMHLLKRL